MTFNNDKNGFRNEIDFIRYLNNKTYDSLEFKLKLFLDELYGEKIDGKIRCYKNQKLQKYDIFIEANNIVK